MIEIHPDILKFLACYGVFATIFTIGIIFYCLGRAVTITTISVVMIISSFILNGIYKSNLPYDEVALTASVGLGICGFTIAGTYWICRLYCWSNGYKFDY